MAYSAKIILDSINQAGNRLTTFELTYPRIVHAEFMTHRLFSRNAASSRAIPIEKMIAAVETDPFIPVWWGKNQKGMQAAEELSSTEQKLAVQEWFNARDQAVQRVKGLQQIGDTGVHKQIANRLLEPWMWITVICSATDYDNFFAQRCDPLAQPEIQTIAYMMRDEYYSNTPELLQDGELHLPFVTGYDRSELTATYSDEEMVWISVARCARVTHLQHDGVRSPVKDIEMFENKLLPGGHWSPFEHVARAADGDVRSGNFHGFEQVRKDYANEFRSYANA